MNKIKKVLSCLAVFLILIAAVPLFSVLNTNNCLGGGKHD